MPRVSTGSPWQVLVFALLTRNSLRKSFVFITSAKSFQPWYLPVAGALRCFPGNVPADSALLCGTSATSAVKFQVAHAEDFAKGAEDQGRKEFHRSIGPSQARCDALRQPRV